MKNETYCWLVLLGIFFFFFQLSCESYMVMDVVVQNPQKSSGYDQGTTMRKNMGVVTPRCAAAAVVSAVVLRRPTKEYTHRYSMMHRRLTTAGIDFAPHYHQLLVMLLPVVEWVPAMFLQFPHWMVHFSCAFVSCAIGWKATCFPTWVCFLFFFRTS